MAHPRHSELASLAEDRNAAQVLAIASVKDIADAYCEYFSVARPDNPDCDDAERDDPNYWVMDFYYGCLGDLPASWRREFLLELIDRAGDDTRLLGVIGAGPFEDYIDRFDSEQVEWLERNATSSASFCEALRTMYLSYDLPDDLRFRINRAAGYPPDRR